MELALIYRDLAERVDDRLRDAELLAQDGIEVEHTRTATGKHDLVDAIRARRGREEVEGLAELAREVLRYGVQNGNDLLDRELSHRSPTLEVFGLIEGKAELTLDGIGVLIAAERDVAPEHRSAA